MSARRATLTGSINENRRLFVGENIDGRVDFGRQWKSFDRVRIKQAVRVHLADGRNAWGIYTDPKNVSLKLTV